MNRILSLVFVFWICNQIFALDVIFRYDDFRLIDDSLQNKLIEVFASENVPLHIAVIPFNRDSSICLEQCEAVERVKGLQKSGVLQIAMHGFCHKGETFNGEFLGLTYEEQLFRLKKGTELLDSVFDSHVHIFIPPWNRYNQTTLDILHDLKYSIISSELHSNQNVSDDRFQYYPEGVDHPLKLIKVIKMNYMSEGLVVCMFHGYDFTESFTIDSLRTIIQGIKANNELNIVTMDSLYNRDNSYNGDRITANLEHPLITKFLYNRPVILTVSEVVELKILNLLIHLLLVIIFAFAGCFVVGWRNCAYWYAYLMIFLMTGVSTWCQFVMPKVNIAIVLICCVTIVSFFAKKKNKFL